MYRQWSRHDNESRTQQQQWHISVLFCCSCSAGSQFVFVAHQNHHHGLSRKIKKKYKAQQNSKLVVLHPFLSTNLMVSTFWKGIQFRHSKRHFSQCPEGSRRLTACCCRGVSRHSLTSYFMLLRVQPLHLNHIILLIHSLILVSWPCNLQCAPVQKNEQSHATHWVSVCFCAGAWERTHSRWNMRNSSRTTIRSSSRTTIRLLKDLGKDSYHTCTYF